MILWVLQTQAPGSIRVPRSPEVQRHRKVRTYWNSVPAAQESRAPSPGLLGMGWERQPAEGRSGLPCLLQGAVTKASSLALQRGWAES